MLNDVAALLHAGGRLAYILVALGIVMWTLVALRAGALWRVGRAAARRRGPTLGLSDASLAYAAVLESLIKAAPLLGLLGTVSGMVETFASLKPSGGVAFTHATEQTVASGISVALITTQLGLVLGIGGLVAARSLDRWAAHSRHRLRESTRGAVP